MAHMCQFGMKSVDEDGATRIVKKLARFASNSRCILDELERRCDGGHNHAQLLGGRASACQVYPDMLCKAVCKGLRTQMLTDKAVMECNLNQVEDEMRGAEEKHKQGGFWDAVNGGWLPPNEVREAREKEMQYIRRMNVYSRVPREECRRVTGKQPIKLKWVDTRKNSGEIRSRLVAKEFRDARKPEMFAATPPLEALKLLVSMVASSQLAPSDWGDWPKADWKYPSSNAGRPNEQWTDDVISLLHVDISRAYQTGQVH